MMVLFWLMMVFCFWGGQIWELKWKWWEILLAVSIYMYFLGGTKFVTLNFVFSQYVFPKTNMYTSESFCLESCLIPCVIAPGCAGSALGFGGWIIDRFRHGSWRVGSDVWALAVLVRKTVEKKTDQQDVWRCYTKTKMDTQNDAFGNRDFFGYLC